MSDQFSRREMLGFAAAATAVAFTGCSSASSGSADVSSDGANSDAVDPGRRPDVVATYRAGPVEFDLAGVVASTWGYSDKIPGEVLRARKGDLVEVTVENGLDEATSIHWHGIAIVNSMDGVPGLTQPDIAAGSSFTYRFVVPDAGTYWFHPHHGLQLDRGLYAPFIIDDPDDAEVDVEHVLVLDDWLDGLGTTPEIELVRIREMGASMEGMSEGEMGGMSMATSSLLGGDAGDAVYPHHLINGHPLSDAFTLDPMPRVGDRVRLRFINAASDTAYRVAIGGHRVTVTHADGFPVVPVEVDAFLIGMGERYDVTVEVRSGAWPIIALAEGKDSRSAAVLRSRDSSATQSPDLLSSLAELDGEWLRYSSLRAADRVALSLPTGIRSIPINLTGGMSGFDWGIDGRPFGQHEPIEVDEGEWLTLAITNTTSMWHPIHLHGHTPQLTDVPGGVRKDTVNVLPGDTVRLTFPADNPGEWMLHCHNAYHLEAGMATVLSYRT